MADRESDVQSAGWSFSDQPRAYLKGPTTGFAQPPVADLQPLPAPAVLAPVMLAAYVGTPDYEGEDLPATVVELEATYAGKWGPLLSDASFATVADGKPVAAVITLEYIQVGKLAAQRPHISFLFTIPEYQGRGIAERLLRASAYALQKAGYNEMGLVVNLENTRAIRLYEHLGFRRPTK